MAHRFDLPFDWLFFFGRSDSESEPRACAASFFFLSDAAALASRASQSWPDSLPDPSKSPSLASLASPSSSYALSSSSVDEAAKSSASASNSLSSDDASSDYGMSTISTSNDQVNGL